MAEVDETCREVAKVVGSDSFAVNTIISQRQYLPKLQADGRYLLCIPINTDDSNGISSTGEESSKSEFGGRSFYDATSFNTLSSGARFQPDLQDCQQNSEAHQEIELQTYALTVQKTKEYQEKKKKPEELQQKQRQLNLSSNLFEELQHYHELGHFSSVNQAFEHSSSDSNPEINISVTRITKTAEFLGATIRNEGDAVVIGRIVQGGAAKKSGQLYEGDEILEVNGVELRGKSVNDVCNILAGMTGTLTFVISRSKDIPIVDPPPDIPIMHVKAYFDYDPEDDPYIPCRELGISFQKGDILHVTNQQDPNWWQAYRDGEEYEPLAGLIPSKSFEERREEIRQMILSSSSRHPGVKIRWKRKKGRRFHFDNKDYHNTEESLTYERVAVYFPKRNRKRPIVLVAPLNFGIKELQQRLLQDDNFASPVPHTSRAKQEREIEGLDYHFISQTKFQEGILAGDFVEFSFRKVGKAYYGTKLDAIRAVVDSGKTCVLSLQPHTLKRLISPSLMPYIIFVAPPSLERLRQKKTKIPLKEKDLKEVIQTGREMEQRYWPYFDLTLINMDEENTYQELILAIRKLEREPQYISASRTAMTKNRIRKKKLSRPSKWK